MFIHTLFLFFSFAQDDFGHRPKVASFLQSVRNYEPVQPRASDVEHGAELGGDDEVAVPAKVVSVVGCAFCFGGMGF